MARVCEQQDDVVHPAVTALQLELPAAADSDAVAHGQAPGDGDARMERTFHIAGEFVAGVFAGEMQSRVRFRHLQVPIERHVRLQAVAATANGR